MKRIKITDRISYLPATDVPLSADSVIISGDMYNWIYDVGRSDEAREALSSLPGEKNVIISHFHNDHMGNLNGLIINKLYCGDFTARKAGRGIAVTEKITFHDGVTLAVFPIPSVHSKGAVGLQVEDSIAFIGDAVYPQEKNGKAAYNVNMLKEMIECLEETGVKQFALSHSAQFLFDRESVITELKEIYKARRPGEAYIFKDRDE